MNIDPTRAMMLIQDYNNDPRKYSDKDALLVSALSKQLGMPFERESKAGRKFLFDAVDTALLGMIPNSLRPKSRGEEVYGENFFEKLGGGAGSLLGLATSGTGAFIAGRGIVRSPALRNVAKNTKNRSIDTVRNQLNPFENIGNIRLTPDDVRFGL